MPKDIVDSYRMDINKRDTFNSQAKIIMVHILMVLDLFVGITLIVPVTTSHGTSFSSSICASYIYIYYGRLCFLNKKYKGLANLKGNFHKYI